MIINNIHTSGTFIPDRFIKMINLINRKFDVEKIITLIKDVNNKFCIQINTYDFQKWQELRYPLEYKNQSITVNSNKSYSEKELEEYFKEWLYRDIPELKKDEIIFKHDDPKYPPIPLSIDPNL